MDHDCDVSHPRQLVAADYLMATPTGGMYFDTHDGQNQQHQTRSRKPGGESGLGLEGLYR